MGDFSVRQATQTARRMVLLAFVGLAFVFGCVLADQAYVHHRYREVLASASKVIDLSWQVALTGHEMTAATGMAAATGSSIWIGVYNGLEPRGAELIDQIVQHLPEDTSQETRDRLIELGRTRRGIDERVFGMVYADDLAAAQALVNSTGYRDTSLAFRNQLEELRQSVRKSVTNEIRRIQVRSWLVSGGLMVLAALFFAIIWRRLNRDMGKSEAAFAVAEARLEQLASFDPLTGMPNRQRLIEEIQQMMIRGERSGQRLAVIALDIDGFRAINDQFGHDVGDRVLREAGRRIISSVRQDEIAARLGDDEFVIAISCQNSQDAPMRVARRIIDLIGQPHLLEGIDVDVRATAGVSIWPDDSALPDELLRKADVALARAKAETRGEVRFFQPVMDADLRERARLQTELKQAIQEGQIVPYFQPVVDLATGAIQGFEVLARWSHPTRGIIAPTAFISFAEDSGLINDLTFSLLRAALKEARAWPGEPTIAINISQRQLIDAKLAGKLLGALADVDFPAHRFEVEVTENALASDIRTAKYILYGLKSRGVRISLDDFGTGYSCLGHLAQLPVDKIKIDRSFTRTMHGQEQSATIIKSIIGLGRSLGLPVIAEGIETLEDAKTLLAMGCATAQGYFFSPPLPAASAQRLLGRPLGYTDQDKSARV
ncbi:MAG TPA: EAL domain-containing protein [Pedomonas sp.]|uniref:putative bifunctional diguanylate cyclase/phosphodiesterase n=1 Tax=Pedomonas sp. TaxID=2976421 RepID=UPI002F3F73AB